MKKTLLTFILFLALFVNVSIANAKLDLGNGLVAHYKMNDDASNTNVEDNINALDGISNQNTSNISTSSGKINSALLFNGSSDKITLSASSSYNTPGSAWSINAWAYTTESSNQNYDGIVSGVYGAGGKVKLYLGMGGPSGASHKITAGFYAPGWYSVASPNTFPTNQWVMVTVTYDGHYLRIYEDGVQTATSTDFNMSLPTDTDGWLIGRGWDSSFWGGKIDDVRLYNRVLGVYDLEALYNNGDGTEDDTPATVVCMDENAINYDPDGDEDDRSLCIYYACPLYSKNDLVLIVATSSVSCYASTMSTTTESMIASLNVGLAIIIVLFFIIVIGFIFNNMHKKPKKY